MGMGEFLSCTLSSAAQDCRSMMSLTAFSPILFSRYLPEDVCSISPARFRMWKLSFPVSMPRAFIRSVKEHSVFSLSVSRISLLVGCESAERILETLSWSTAIM